jgi:hypothetical protein|tara:strand:- start:2610 stop:2858 length:249 start_codon:yes stop_codon:yes gene_type:complete
VRTLQEKPEASCIDASRMAQDELASVEAKIASLLRLKDEQISTTDATDRTITDSRVVSLYPATTTGVDRPIATQVGQHEFCK